MGRKIYALGETVYDIIFKNGQPVSSCPGGSVLNSSVSLGKCGLPVHFISEFANDLPGKTTNELLNLNNVNTELVFRYDNGKTKLAIAFLNDHNNAVYDFYKQYPDKRLEIKIPDFSSDDFLLFGSYFSVDAEIRTTVKEFLLRAKSAGSLILYDPNYRKAHLNELNKLKNSIIENIEFAKVIRASDEDMKLIFDVNTPEKAFELFNNTDKILIYTRGKNNVHLISKNINKEFPVPSIHTVSTIAAGDSFNAGIIYSFYKHEITLENISKLTQDYWDEIIQSGIDFATDVCLRYDNYISDESSNKLKKILNH